MAVFDSVDAHSEAVSGALNFFLSEIKKLKEDNEVLSSKFQYLSLDYQSELDRRRQLQLENNAKNEILRKNNYVIVLVDGDGMIFQDELLREGGKEAAKRILQRTRISIARFFGEKEGSSEWKIHVNIFASVGKISEILARKNFPNFREFVTEFNQCDPFLNFIDVGMGKEMTDHRVRGHIHWNLDNYNCRAVLLAASHDNGYARDLSTINAHSRDEKVVLIEGPPFAREFAQFRFPTIPWHDIFLADKLVDPRTLPPPQLPTPSPVSVASSPQLPKAQLQPQPPAQPQPTIVTRVATVTNGNSFAAIANKSPPPGFATPTSTATPRSASVVSWKTYEEKNKPKKVLQAPKPEIFDHLKHLKPRACNDHYLRGCTRAVCPFSHDHKLNKEQVDAIRYFARQVRCNYGMDCTNDRCIAGHGCKAPLDSYGRCSRGDRCKFPMSEHPGRDEY